MALSKVSWVPKETAFKIQGLCEAISFRNKKYVEPKKALI